MIEVMLTIIIGMAALFVLSPILIGLAFIGEIIADMFKRH